MNTRLGLAGCCAIAWRNADHPLSQRKLDEVQGLRDGTCSELVHGRYVIRDIECDVVSKREDEEASGRLGC